MATSKPIDLKVYRKLSALDEEVNRFIAIYCSSGNIDSRSLRGLIKYFKSLRQELTAPNSVRNAPHLSLEPIKIELELAQAFLKAEDYRLLILQYKKIEDLVLR